MSGLHLPHARALILAGFMVALSAWPQPRSEIRVTILDVGYNSAYRNGSWVPVDVLVENEREDVRGHLEVRTLWNTNQAQSPIYRIPIESPKHSRKRFRVHCFLNDTMRVEAAMYQGGRRVQEVPTWINVTPIRPSDALVLVLDEISGNYAFLYNVLQDASGNRRVYRHELDTERLSNLPGFAACFDAFDMIVMSDIDPGRISVRHRELLRDYVTGGGVLVAGIGEGATRYRGSWMEELLGVRVGEAVLVQEHEYVPKVFSKDGTIDVSRSRQYRVATLEPAVEGVLVRGESDVVATMRRVGSGVVVGLAVDGPSKALQGTQGHAKLWREIAGFRAARRGLNYDQASYAVAQQLPWISGVRIQPKSTVMTYLAAYVLIGIVGNWLFWNRLKRREWAWVCLVIISIGFTAYAATFGTIGRAESSEVSFIDILEVPLGGDSAQRHALAGVLTAGTAWYSGSLASEYALAGEAALPGAQGYSGAVGAAPFTLVEGAPARVEGMRVGASELRLIHIEDQVPVSGGIEGTLTHNADGLHGRLVNRVGLELYNPHLYFQGKFYPLNSFDGGWNVTLSPDALRGGGDTSFRPAVDRYLQGHGWGAPGRANTVEAVRESMVVGLLVRTERGGMPSLDPLLGPLVVGWSAQHGVSALRLDDPVPQRLHETLVIADVAVTMDDARGTIPVELGVQTPGRSYGRQQNRDAFTIHAATSVSIFVDAPPAAAGLFDTYGAVRLELRRLSDGPRLRLFAINPETGRHDELQSMQGADESAETIRYVLENWSSYVLSGQSQISLTLQAGQTRPSDNANVEVTFRASVDRHNDTHEDWKPWPLSRPLN